MENNRITYLISWETFVNSNNDSELIHLIEPGDDVKINGELFTIIAPSNDGHSIVVRPHAGYLGDRVFSIKTILENLDENLIIERRIKRLGLGE